MNIHLITASRGEANASVRFSMSESATVSHWNTVRIPEPSGLGLKLNPHRSGYQVVITPGSVENTVVVSIESRHVVEIKETKTRSNLSVETPITEKCKMRYTLAIGEKYNNKGNGPCGISVSWLY